MKLAQKFKVKNSMGLHTRPAAEIVKILQNCNSDVHFTYKKETVNAKSILSILILAAQKNSTIKVTVEGRDAEEIMRKLGEGFNSKFGEI